MSICPSCSGQVAPGKRFCADCGAAMATNAATQTSVPDSTGAVTSRPSMTPLPYKDSRFLPGAMVTDRYRIVGLLGRGGMGEVYRADDLKLGQPVALKFLPESVSNSPDRRERFFSEARVALRVTHPNVCRVHDIGEVDGQLFLSMEYIDGEDLASLLRRIGRLPEDKAIEITRQLCAGLAAAHDEGILHRDLKPANVMLDGRGRARITDFGLAGLEEAFKGDEVRAGTPGYMAPEQIAGTEVTVKSDLYSLGLLMYELFTGKQAFTGDTAMEIARKQTTSLPTSPTSHVSNLAPATESIILRCLEKEPAKRPDSAPAVAAALPGGDPLAAAIAAGETPSPELVAAAGEREAMSPVLALLVAVLSVGVFGAAATLAARDDLRAYVAPDKPPEALKDRARDVVRTLGYTEEIYSDPADSAVGYSTWTNHLDYIEENDDSPERWQQLKHARPGAVSFWYRQTPGTYFPRATWGSIGIPPVSRWNPFPNRTGEILVSLDMQGRLSFFSATPRRFIAEGTSTEEPDWSGLFELAELDPGDFTPVEPRYQRFMDPDHRAAWVGHLPSAPDLELRIEAGWHEGRPVLFGLLWPWEVDLVSADPVRSTGIGAQQMIGMLVFLAIIVFATFLARRNLKRGRADRNGARRLMVAVFVLRAAWELFRAPVGLYGNPTLLIFVLASALFDTVLLGAAYVALEPYARRIWPTMLTSWSRLVGGEVLQWRDASVGRSVLWGLAGGAVLTALQPLGDFVNTMAKGGAVKPPLGNWTVVLGQRMVLAEVVNGLQSGAAAACMITLMLIGFRFIVRRRLPAMIVIVILFSLLGAFDDEYASVLIGFILSAVALSILMGILVRFGFLSTIVASFVFPSLFGMAATADWTAWYARPAWTAMVLVTLLAAYGYWAATSGRRLIPEE